MAERKRKRKIVVVCGSRSDLKHIRDGINALRIAEKRGIISWGRVDICSTHRNPKELRDNIGMYIRDGVDAIIAVAGKLAALFGDVDAHVRNVLHNGATRVIPVPLKGKDEQASMAALLSVLQVPNHQMIFQEEFFHNPTAAFEYAISGDLPTIILEKQKPSEPLTPAEAYELTRIKYPQEASYDNMIKLLEDRGLYHMYTGKTRETFISPEFPDLLYILATDRISIFDIVLNARVPMKGSILTAMTVFWLTEVFANVPNHLVAFGKGIGEYLPEKLRTGSTFEILAKNMLVVKKTKVLKIEAIMRGFLTGSSLKDYKKTGSICGFELPEGMIDGSNLPYRLFTPSTKADYGLHDENISYEEAVAITGRKQAEKVQGFSQSLYSTACTLARAAGIIIADTKFEFGLDKNGDVILIDEVLTPDSSRFWPEEERQLAMEQGKTPPSLDKQPIRNAGEAAGVKENPDWVPPKELLEETSGNYQKIFALLAKRSLEEFQKEAMGV